MFKILLAYGIPPKIVEAIKIMYENNSVLTQEGETEYFKIKTGVLQGDPLAPFLFIIVLDYALRKAIDKSDGLTLSRRRSRRHPSVHLADLDFADDIVLIDESIREAERVLHKVELATQSIGLFLNVQKTKYMHMNSTSNQSFRTVDGSELELVEDFEYLGSYSETTTEVNRRIGQAWSSLNRHEKCWKSNISNRTKLKIFDATTISFLLYACESWSLNKSLERKIDGSYTRMLRRVKNINPLSHTTNRALYGKRPPISKVIQNRRLRLAGHVARGNEPATKLLFWEPEKPKRIGRPTKTISKLIKEDTGLEEGELFQLMQNRDRWREHIMSPKWMLKVK